VPCPLCGLFLSAKRIWHAPDIHEGSRRGFAGAEEQALGVNRAAGHRTTRLLQEGFVQSGYSQSGYSQSGHNWQLRAAAIYRVGSMQGRLLLCVGLCLAGACSSKAGNQNGSPSARAGSSASSAKGVSP
jgi:hypothetical protein